MSFQNDRVAIERDAGAEGVAEVSLTRGDKHNGIDMAMFEGINAALDDLAGDDSVRCVVLHGEGPSFCAGLDIQSFTGGNVFEEVTREVGDNPANLAQRVAYGWRQLPVPVIAALHGACFGGGAQIALGADIRFAAPDTKVSIMEMKYGLIPDMGLSQMLFGLVRDDLARELVYTARIVEAEEAARIGLVTRVSETALEDARKLAAEIAAKPERTVRSAKRWLNEMPRLSESDALALEEDLQRELISALVG